MYFKCILGAFSLWIYILQKGRRRNSPSDLLWGIASGPIEHLIPKFQG